MVTNADSLKTLSQTKMNLMALASLSGIDRLYKYVAFLDVNNIERLWNGARFLPETVKYMHPRHLHASNAMLCNMQHESRAVHIVTDGSCYRNPGGASGCAAIVHYPDHMGCEDEQIVDFGCPESPKKYVSSELLSR